MTGSNLTYSISINRFALYIRRLFRVKAHSLNLGKYFLCNSKRSFRHIISGHIRYLDGHRHLQPTAKTTVVRWPTRARGASEQ